jgi:hypothetical protein
MLDGYMKLQLTARETRAMAPFPELGTAPEKTALDNGIVVSAAVL